MGKIFAFLALFCFCVFQGLGQKGVPESWQAVSGVFAGCFILFLVLTAVLHFPGGGSGGRGAKEVQAAHTFYDTQNERLHKYADLALTRQQEQHDRENARWHATLQSNNAGWERTVQDANRTGLAHANIIAQLATEQKRWLQEAYDAGYRIDTSRHNLLLMPNGTLQNPGNYNPGFAFVEPLKALQAAGGNIQEAEYREL